MGPLGTGMACAGDSLLGAVVLKFPGDRASRLSHWQARRCLCTAVAQALVVKQDKRSSRGAMLQHAILDCHLSLPSVRAHGASLVSQEVSSV